MAQEVTLQTVAHSVETVANSVEKFTNLFIEYKKDTDLKFGKIDEGFGSIDKRFDKIDRQFEIIDQRFSRIDKQFEANNQKFSHIDEKFEGLTEIMISHFDRLDKKINDVKFELKEDIRAVVRVSSLLSPR